MVKTFTPTDAGLGKLHFKLESDTDAIPWRKVFRAGAVHELMIRWIDNLNLEVECVRAVAKDAKGQPVPTTGDGLEKASEADLRTLCAERSIKAHALGHSEMIAALRGAAPALAGAK